ncbi:OmpA family protein [Xanthocytophaga flava]|uniref:OmpA family protein n=1 Tax=Xanthocytophaga flava TaxID=3048013 RepID=UPI0028D252EB|nr:OmpA family protein [Xanthocytophaga flavus]MDJ1467056.1 OmpA family protein [Xanthocytophaga flavus]
MFVHFRKITFLIALLISISSCVVGKKKYDAEVALKKTAQQQLDDALKKITALQSDTSQLNNQLQYVRQELKGLLDNYQQLETKYKQANEQLANRQKTNDQLRTELNRREKELQDKEATLAEREKLVQELQDAIRKKEEASKALLDRIKGALSGFNSDELSITLKDGLVYVSLSDKLLFKSGKTDVDAKGKQALGQLATELNKNPDIQITIEGHTDNVPIKTAVFNDNWDLSVMRATSIVRLLTKEYDVDPRRLTPSGRSEYFPKAANTTPEGKSQNRRTEIILSPKLDELYRILEGK